MFSESASSPGFCRSPGPIFRSIRRNQQKRTFKLADWKTVQPERLAPANGKIHRRGRIVPAAM
jgi:hypothetical protein